MLSVSRSFQSETEAHEELFLERYLQVFQWALQLADGNRGVAEDLVQDAFLDFTQSRLEIATIRNLEGFLYQSLRNLHRSRLHRDLRLQQLLVHREL